MGGSSEGESNSERKHDQRELSYQHTAYCDTSLASPFSTAGRYGQGLYFVCVSTDKSLQLLDNSWPLFKLTLCCFSRPVANTPKVDQLIQI